MASAVNKRKHAPASSYYSSAVAALLREIKEQHIFNDQVFIEAFRQMYDKRETLEEELDSIDLGENFQQRHADLEEQIQQHYLEFEEFMCENVKSEADVRRLLGVLQGETRAFLTKNFALYAALGICTDKSGTVKTIEIRTTRPGDSDKKWISLSGLAFGKVVTEPQYYPNLWAAIEVCFSYFILCSSHKDAEYGICLQPFTFKNECPAHASTLTEATKKNAKKLYDLFVGQEYGDHISTLEQVMRFIYAELKPEADRSTEEQELMDNRDNMLQRMLWFNLILSGMDGSAECTVFQIEIVYPFNVSDHVCNFISAFKSVLDSAASPPLVLSLIHISEPTRPS